MNLDKAIKHGKEKRRSYEQRGKPGRFDRTCRPHGGGTSMPCPYCKRSRLFHAARDDAEVKDQMADLKTPNVLVTGQPLAGPVDQRVSALVEKRDDA